MFYKLQAKLWNTRFTGEIPRLQFNNQLCICWQNSLLFVETTGGSKHHAVFFARARKSMEDFSRWPDPRCCAEFYWKAAVFLCRAQPFAVRTPLCVVFRSAQFLIRNLCGAAIKRASEREGKGAEQARRKLECAGDMQPAGHSHCWAAGHCLDRRVLMQFRSIFCPSAARVSHRAQIKCGDGSGRCIRACLNCNGWDNVMLFFHLSHPWCRPTDRPAGRTLQALHYSADRIISFMSKWVSGAQSRPETFLLYIISVYIETMHLRALGPKLKSSCAGVCRNY
jgi:hypothetical protein